MDVEQRQLHPVPTYWGFHCVAGFINRNANHQGRLYTKLVVTPNFNLHHISAALSAFAHERSWVANDDFWHTINIGVVLVCGFQRGLDGATKRARQSNVFFKQTLSFSCFALNKCSVVVKSPTSGGQYEIRDWTLPLGSIPYPYP